MFCQNCGKSNPEGSHYCEHCGIKLDKVSNKDLKTVSQNIPQQDESDEEKDISKEPPYPYYVSILKLSILSIATFGIYGVYWLYRQYKYTLSLKKQKGFFALNLAAALNLIFFLFTGYRLFSDIYKLGKGSDYKKRVIPGLMFFAAFLLGLSARFPLPYSLLYYLEFLAFIPIQNAMNEHIEKEYGIERSGSKFGAPAIIALILGILWWGVDLSWNIYACHGY